MRKLFQNRRFLRLAIPGILFLALLVAPSAAHADGIATSILSTILDSILSTVTVVNALLGQLLDFANKALTFALDMSLAAILETRVIDVAWRIMRDMANFVFIIMLVVISFSTIFSVIPGLKRFNYRTALVPLIIAALLMNFSLAIGKTVVLVSDQVARIFIEIMPQLGGDLTKALGPQKIVLDPVALVGPLPANQSAIFDATKDLTAAEDKRYKECLNEVVPIGGLATKLGFSFTEGERKSIGDCNLEIISARQAFWTVQAGQKPTDEQASAFEALRASTPSNVIENKIFLIFSGILSALLLLILTLCLITPFLFILLRIIMLWVLLFSSPIAWAGYAVPDSGVFEKWWKLFIGWNLFGPVYLFVLIPGMIVLQSSGELLTALNGLNGALDTAGGLFQIFLFYAFAILIFLGGLWAAMQTSFAGAVRATPFLDKVAGWVGVGGTFGPAQGAARFASRITGATAAYENARARGEARVAQVKQGAKSIQDQSRLLQLVKPVSYEEKLAAAKMRLGVPAGPKEKEFAELKAGQVKVESDFLEKKMAGMTLPGKVNHLKESMKSKNPAIQLAAREKLLALGMLTDEEITETRKLYPTIPARQEFDKRVRGSARAALEAKKKEAKEAGEDLAVQLGKKTYSNVKDVTDTLRGLTPDETKVAMEAIGKKAPLQLMQYLKGLPRAGEPLSPAALYSQAFASVLKDKDALVKLDPKYFKKDTDEFKALREVINIRHPIDPKDPKKRNARRDKYKDDLLIVNPSLLSEINELFEPIDPSKTTTSP